MKNRGIQLVVFGFILLIIGAGLIVFLNPESSNSVFYVFPFFFVVTSGNSLLIVLIIIVVLFVVCSLLFIMMRHANPIFSPQSMSSCSSCEEPVPHGSRFCPRCGKQIEGEGGEY